MSAPRFHDLSCLPYTLASPSWNSIQFLFDLLCNGGKRIYHVHILLFQYFISTDEEILDGIPECDKFLGAVHNSKWLLQHGLLLQDDPLVIMLESSRDQLQNKTCFATEERLKNCAYVLALFSRLSNLTIPKGLRALWFANLMRLKEIDEDVHRQIVHLMYWTWQYAGFSYWQWPYSRESTTNKSLV